MKHEPVSPAYRPPVFLGGTDTDMTLDKWVGRLPKNHLARVQLGLLRVHIEKLEHALFRNRNEET